MRSAILAALAIASVGVVPSRANAQTGPAVIAGTVFGNDQPVYAARIRLVAADTDRVIAETASNAWGRFKLQAVPSGRYRLEVRRMGFVRRQIQLDVDSTQLDPMRIDLERYVSECPAEQAPAVLTEVRDEKTGANLVQGARLEMTAQGRTPSAVEQVDQADSTRVVPLAGGDMPGTYRVVVSRPGYKSWSKDNVVVRSGVCGVQTVFLRAQLKRETRTLVAETPKH